MSKGANENWFQSPHINRNGVWAFHEDKVDIFNLSRLTAQDKQTFFNPSRQSKLTEMQKYHKTPNNNSIETQNDKFEDINLPDMFSNTLIAGQVINQKINFEEQSIVQEEDDCVTPSKGNPSQVEADDNYSKELPKTAVKEHHRYSEEEKKTRPKEKGLRMLSQKAYDIVTKMNGATYKEVANKLVDQLAVQDTLEINGKDQQNIKRRVYDALNVLIALGTLKKDGRKIYGVKDEADSQSSRIEEMKRLLEQTQMKQFRIMQKVKQYNNARVRAQMIRALIKRNSQAFQKHNKVEFPFIAFCIQAEDQNKVIVKKHQIQICSSLQQVEPFGDLDTIQFLRPSLKSLIE